MEEMIELIREREFEFKAELLQKEKIYIDKIENANVFGRMCEKIQIAINLVELGILDNQTIAEVTGMSLSHVESIAGRS